MGARKKLRGRRPCVAGPPRLEPPLVVGGPRFSGDDLKRLAEAAGLEISVSADVLAEVAVELRYVLCSYVLDTQYVGLWREPTSTLRNWATDTASIMRECIAALGGNSAASNLLDDATAPASATAQLLQGGLLVAEGRGQSALIRDLLQRAANRPIDGTVDVRTLEPAIERLVSNLAALALVAEAASDSWTAYQARYGRRLKATGLPQAPRWKLFYQLASIFEQLHRGRKYAVSKYPSGGSHRQTKTAGPAVAWTRELFALASDPKAKHSSGFTPLPELVTLRDWAVKKSVGFGEHIDEAGRRYRQSQPRTSEE